MVVQDQPKMSNLGHIAIKAKVIIMWTLKFAAGVRILSSTIEYVIEIR